MERERTALVTGGAHGIGEACSRALAAAGFRTFVADVDARGASALVENLGGPSRGHQAVELDVTDPGRWKRTLETTVGDHPLDVLYLNAGIMASTTGAAEVDLLLAPGELEAVVGVNLGGVVHGLRAALPALRAARGASVVVTASTAGVWGFTGDPLYVASKFAVVGLVASLAPILRKDGIALTCICPGSTRSRMTPNLAEAADGTLRSRRTGKVVQQPERIAEVLLDLVEHGTPGDIVVVEPGRQPWAHHVRVT